MFRLLRIQYTGENATIYLTASSIIDRVKYEMGRDKGIRCRVAAEHLSSEENGYAKE